MLKTQISKSTLAKLLATENISVEYRKVQTASFDIVNRRLTLPIMNDTTPEMTDLLVGHEVGHALDTPQSYVESAKAGGSAFSTFLNVVEDARVERRMKDRYPGLRKPMAIAYRQFTERDFFGIKGQDVNAMMLIDRINLHFKLGAIAGIKFNAEEMSYVNEVEKADSFEQVKDITERLYAFCKAELDQKRQEAKEEFEKRKENGEFDDEDFGDDSFGGDDAEDYEDKNPNDYDSNGSDDGDDDFESEDNFDNGYSNTPTFEQAMPNELKVYGNEVKSVTDEKFQQALKGLAETKEINVGKIASQKKIDLKNYIIPFKELQFFDESFFDNEELEAHERYDSSLLMKFESKNKNPIAYLVKEFEMKKKAAELRRVTVSDTGTLDTNKLHTYKFNDDIFRKIGAVAQGKNHGIVMFIDWSGSMCDNMSGTIEQLITMATFCRKVNIPFDVYAFSTEYRKNLIDRPNQSIDMEPNQLDIDYFSLMNILSSTMKNQTYRKFANDLLNVADAYKPYTSYRRNYKSSYIKEGMGLGGTPLNATIQVASNVVNDFRKRTRSEIVNVIFLTDGEDSSTMWTSSNDNRSTRIGPSDFRSVSYIEDKDSAKTYRVSDKGVTPTLLQILKDRTGCNLIGFYILPKSKRYFQNAMSRFNMIMTDDGYKQFRNEKFFSVNGYGYSEYFLIPGGEDLSTDDDSLSDILGEAKDVSARKLKGAFMKMNQNRLTNRVLLSKVIKEIA
jgi:hypothetical protein